MPSQGLDAEKADLFAYLSALPDASLGGVVCCQVVEHLPPARLPEMIRLVHAKLRAGGLLAIETPNPECLAIFATHFYIDPTHRHPIPPALASFYLEEAGFGRIEIERLSPAIESMPSLAELPEAFRKEFFGSSRLRRVRDSNSASLWRTLLRAVAIEPARTIPVTEAASHSMNAVTIE